MSSLLCLHWECSGHSCSSWHPAPWSVIERVTSQTTTKQGVIALDAQVFFITGALLVQPTLLRLLRGVMSTTPLNWVPSQACWGRTRCPGCWWYWTTMRFSISSWHIFPLLIKWDMLWDFTMVIQDRIQSLVRQMGIFSMSLPVAQWFGSLDIIKLWLVAPNFLSTGRSSFKQLSSWLSHRQKCKTCLARNFTPLGYQPGI